MKYHSTVLDLLTRSKNFRKYLIFEEASELRSLSSGYAGAFDQRDFTASYIYWWGLHSGEGDV